MNHIIEQLDRAAAEPSNTISRVYVASDEAMRLRAGLEALALAERLARDIRDEVERLRTVDKQFGGTGDLPIAGMYAAWADALEGVCRVCE